MMRIFGLVVATTLAAMGSAWAQSGSATLDAIRSRGQ